MLFHSSIRKELARSFGATLVVLVTVVMTMTLIRTVGEASRGSFNPADVMIIMGYTVLADLPTILSLSLFMSILGVLTRMFRDSEMVIWFGSGRGLASLIRPLLRFSWPILVVILTLAFFILPWAFGRIEDLRDKYEKRGDIARIEAGQFQESASGDRVFFIEKDEQNDQAGSNVFIATREADKETVTSASSGRIQTIGSDRFLVLEKGQRLERTRDNAEVSVSQFDVYGIRIGTEDQSARKYVTTSAISTLELAQSKSPRLQAELSWRLGLPMAAFNLVILGVALAGVNPRVGRTANLGFAFMAFVVYLNMLLMGKTWIESGQIGLVAFFAGLHGGTLVLALLWLFKRHNQWTVRLPRRAAP